MAVEWMCPSCARLVDRSDRTCSCGENLKARRPVKVSGPARTFGQRLQSPLFAWLCGTIFFVLFAFAAAGNPTIGRGFVYTLGAWLMIGWVLILYAKLQEGLEELICYRPFRHLLNDPMDSWVLTVMLVALQGVGLMMLVITPSMPKGVSYWP